MVGRVFLGGGGSAEQSRSLDDELVAQFDQKRKGTCLYVPLAMDETKHESAKEWFQENYGHRFAAIEMVGDLSKFDHSVAYDVIYIGGGNTGKLLDGIYKSSFDGYIKKHLGDGGIVYGGSAGAIVLGRTILTAPEVEHSATKNDGLDLLSGYAVAAHYQDERDHSGISDLGQRLECSIIAIPEDAGVIVDLGAIKAVGNSDVVVFPSGQEPYNLER